MRYISCGLLNCCTTEQEKSHFKGLQLVINVTNELENHSRSSELPLFDRPYVTILYHFLLVVRSNNVSTLYRFRNIATITLCDCLLR